MIVVQNRTVSVFLQNFRVCALLKGTVKVRKQRCSSSRKLVILCLLAAVILSSLRAGSQLGAEAREAKNEFKS